MRYLLIGHRGTGKTSLLQRLHQYFPEVAIFDLDSEIAKKMGVTISEYFQKHGEVSFREVEQQTLSELLHKNKTFIISCGAGLEIEKVKTDAEIIWVKRYTDKLGRVFLNRPRLQKEGSPLDEYMHRYKERNILYQRYASEVVDIPEGFDTPNPYEEAFFKNTLRFNNWTVTLQTSHFRSPEILKKYIQKRQTWGLKFELRDDILTKEQIHQIISLVPKQQILVSFRQKNPSKDLIDYTQKQQIDADWDLSLGEPPYPTKIVSLHQAEHLQQGLDRLAKYPDSIQKAAFTVSHLEELVVGDAWLHESSQRAFLPRSHDGIWKWYRLYRHHKQAINFLSDQSFSQIDQPQVLEALRNQDFQHPKKFAAVLGKPIEHSLSPSTHYEFFKPHQIPFYAITLNEWDLKSLQKLGLEFAAVTSPYKESAYASTSKKSKDAEDLKSVNTMVLQDRSVYGYNSDLYGLKQCLSYAKLPVVVWGGGGLLSSIKSHLPQAFFYSSRSGAAKSATIHSSPKTIIWAVGRKHFESQGVFPPTLWSPELVIDMNYTDDSYGKIYAQSLQAEYISGMTLFQEQAKRQQEIWSRHLPLPL